jgi:hypothetical protein
MVGPGIPLVTKTEQKVQDLRDPTLVLEDSWIIDLGVAASVTRHTQELIVLPVYET